MWPTDTTMVYYLRTSKYCLTPLLWFSYQRSEQRLHHQKFRDYLYDYWCVSLFYISMNLFRSMLIVCVAGHVLYYISNSTCRSEARNMMKLMGNVILIQYLRLIQVIMIAFLILLCCPFFIFCNYFRNNR